METESTACVSPELLRRKRPRKSAARGLPKGANATEVWAKREEEQEGERIRAPVFVSLLKFLCPIQKRLAERATIMTQTTLLRLERATALQAQFRLQIPLLLPVLDKVCCEAEVVALLATVMAEASVALIQLMQMRTLLPMRM